MKYLYGASIQGIQNFIFETSKLREIAGASEIVDFICSKFFENTIGKEDYNQANLLIGAAGNIKYLFDDYESCQKLVRHFPKKVIQLAPGIAISQAVVQVEGEFKQEHIQQLEERLKVQRNKPPIQHGLGLMVSERSRRTGKAGVAWKNEVVIDAAQKSKSEFTEDSKVSLLRKLVPHSEDQGYHKLFPVEMEDIAGRKDKKNWIAIIHADGNDLSKKIIEFASGSPKKEDYRDLSQRIRTATEQATRIAFDKVFSAASNEDDFFQFRPIVLGGDDLTVIIRGDLAIDFTHAFLKAFEKKTKEEFKGFDGIHFQDGLTACAGIAYIKANYPFHYGVHLADELCSQAKKVAKNMKHDRTPSCMLFYKVHSSFIDDYSSIIEQTLKAGDFRLDFGPYFLQSYPGYATIDQLIGWIGYLNEKASPKSRIRNWLLALKVNEQAAKQELDRIMRITNPRYVKKLQLDGVFTERGEVVHTHLYDAIALSSIENHRK